MFDLFGKKDEKKEKKNEGISIKMPKIKLGIDTDSDGVIDSKDCQPLNPSKQDEAKFSKHKMKKDCQVNSENIAPKGSLIFINRNAPFAAMALYIRKDPNTGKYSLAQSKPAPNPTTKALTEKRYTEEEARKALRKELQDKKLRGL